MKEADWTIRPSTEMEIAEEKRRHLARRRTGWAFALSTAGLCPLSCIGIGLSVFEHGSAALIFLPALALVAVGAEYSRRCRRADAFAHARLTTIREEYADLHGWLAEVCVLQGAAPTGFDLGVLWFEDDRLLFVGERTSFALSTRDVHSGYREHWGARGLLPTTTLPLSVRTAAGQVAVGFKVTTEYIPGQPYQGVDAFRKALRGWLAAGQGAEGQVPPLTLGPGVPSLGALLRSALTVTLIWCLLLGLAGASLWASGAEALAGIAFAGVLLLACSELWTLRLRWQAWRDRRRFEAYNRDK